MLEAGARKSAKRMKRYYFDMQDGDGFAPDEEGLELPDIEAAQEEAALSLADMARDAVRISRRIAHLMQIEARDDNGRVRLSYARCWQRPSATLLSPKPILNLRRTRKGRR